MPGRLRPSSCGRTAAGRFRQASEEAGFEAGDLTWRIQSQLKVAVRRFLELERSGHKVAPKGTMRSTFHRAPATLAAMGPPHLGLAGEDLCFKARR